MKRLTVQRITRKVHVPGYTDPIEQDIHQLGYRTRMGFIVVEEEVIPKDIAISLATLGYAGREWTSKFANWIAAKHGGCAEKFQGA